MNAYVNALTISGAAVMTFAILAAIFPPKFGSYFWEGRTKWTMKNELIWQHGQKLFSIANFIIGLIFLLIGFLVIPTKMQYGLLVILTIALWSLAKRVVDYFLSKKYSK
jgi:uncharacterized membrane protein